MRLRPGGMDIFYIDESHDSDIYVVTSIAVPFIRNVEGTWTIVWENHLDDAKAWRDRIRDNLHIPTRIELHGKKLARGKGQYRYGRWNFRKSEAANIYREILSWIDFVPNLSIMSVACEDGDPLYGHEKLEGALHGLFQRMRSHCKARKCNGIVFFDQGHPEYRHLYRRAQVYLETGSMYRGWGGGQAIKNLPLGMFTKDGNEKNSKFCHFTQAADLIAYAAFLKMKSERTNLEPWQAQRMLHNLHDSVPRALLNTKVSLRPPKDGIKRLWQ